MLSSARHSGESRNPAPCSLFVPEVQSVRLALRASRLLFGMTAGILPFAASRPASLFAPLLRRSAQKVAKKARRRTRRSDSHRANRTALRFSASRGRSDSTVPVLLRDRGDPSPRPFGLIPRSLRCSAPRTAPVVHEPVHPCTASLRSFASLPIWRNSHKCERLLLRQDAAQTGPLWRGERAEEKPEGSRARRARGRPRNPLANLEGRMPGRRATRGVFLLVTFLCTSKEKLPARPQGEWKPCT